MMTNRPLIGALILTAWIAEQAAARPPDVYDRWQTFTTGNGLPDASILAVEVSGDAVWVGTAGGLARCEDGSWTSWTVDDGLPSPAISAIAVDPRTRDVWLGTWGGGLVRFTGGRFDRFSQLNSGLAGNLVFAVAATGERIWAATNGGLSAFDTDRDTWALHFERRADAEETAITGLRVDGDRLYAAAWCGGVWALRTADAQWSLLTADDTTLGAAAAANGSLWLATSGSVVQWSPDGRRAAWPAPGAAGPLVSCVGVDSAGNVHLGTDAGLWVLTDRSPATWAVHERHGTGPEGLLTLVRDGRKLGTRVTASGLPDDRVRCVALQDDAVWVGTAGGLARSTRGGRWEDLPPAPQPADVAAIAVDPIDTDAIRIGVLRPGERMIGVPGSRPGEYPRLRWVDLMAVNLALEHANDRGGYRGQIPFALATGPQGWFKGWGWTTPEDNFPELARLPDVMGIVAHLGSGSRLTTAVAQRSELPVVNFAPTAATTDELVSPWIFRCRGAESRAHRLVLDYLFDQLGCARVTVLRDTSPLDPVQLDWWRSDAMARGHPIATDLRCDPEAGGLDEVLRALRESKTDVVLTWSDPRWSAAILRGMRQAGMDQLFVGSDAIMSEEFVDRAGPQPGAVIAACPGTDPPDRTAAARFAEQYLQRFGRPPTAGAHRVYEAVDHLLTAITVAGPDREAVRRALHAMSRDVDGERHCQRTPDRAGQVILGRLQAGGWDLCTISDLGLTEP